MTGWWELGTQITPWGWIFWTMIFYNLKYSGQDLSNEGSIANVKIDHVLNTIPPQKRTLKVLYKYDE